MILACENIEQEMHRRCHCLTASAMVLMGASQAAAGGAAIAANIALVGTVMSTVGTIQQGKAAAGQARFQSQVANNNAIVAQQQADRAVQQAKVDEDDFRRQQSRLLASRRAVLGNSGVEAAAGSPLLVSEDFAGESELNALRIRNQGAVNVNRLEQNVLNQQAQSGLFANQAQTAGRNAFFRAGSTLLSGAGTISNIARGRA
jgi:hypothetical protein